jgi:hypothetical protein
VSSVRVAARDAVLPPCVVFVDGGWGAVVVVAMLVMGLDSRRPRVVVGTEEAAIAGVGEGDVIDELRLGTLPSMMTCCGGWLLLLWPLPALTARSTDDRGDRLGDAGMHVLVPQRGLAECGSLCVGPGSTRSRRTFWCCLLGCELW